MVHSMPKEKSESYFFLLRLKKHLFLLTQFILYIAIGSCPRIMEALIFSMVMSTKAIECARTYAPMVIDSKVVAG